MPTPIVTHPTVAQRENRTGLGLLLMASAVFFFTLIDTSAKWLATAGFATLQIVFLRYSIHFAISLAMFLPREGRRALRSNAPRRQLLRSTMLFVSTALNFAALHYLPITVTITILFAGPIAITLLAIPILGERVGPHRIGAVIVGFSGVLVVMQPWGTGFHPAMLLSLSAMLCASLYFILTRMLAGVDSNATAQIWSSGVGAICLAPFVVSLWQWPTDPIGWLPFVLIGVFGAVGHNFVTNAHRMADASILAPMMYVQMIFAALVSILVFGTWPTLWTFLGGLIIAGAGLYVWHRERRNAGDL